MSDQVINDPTPDAAVTDANTDSDVLVGTGASAPDVTMPAADARTNVSAAGIGATSAGAVTGRAKGMLVQTAPWRRSVGWQAIGAEGLIAVAVGIYLVADPDGAQDV